MDVSTVAAQGLAIGRVAVEHYFEEVLEGACLIEAQFLKNIILSDMYSHCKNNVLLNLSRLYLYFCPKVL